MKKTIKILAVVFTVVLILGIGGCALALFTANEAVETIDKEIKKVEQKTEDQDALLQGMLDKAQPVEKKDEFSYTVEYTLVNDTGEDFDYIQVEYDVFDANGVKLGNNFTNITDVKNGQTFKITLDLYQEGATTYKVTKISSTAF